MLIGMLLVPCDYCHHAATWAPALHDGQIFNDQLVAFANIAAFELQNTTSYINAYRTAEANARFVRSPLQTRPAACKYITSTVGV